MPAIDFPSSPTNGQVFTSGDHTWIYSSALPGWKLEAQTVTGPTGPTGYVDIENMNTQVGLQVYR